MIADDIISKITGLDREIRNNLAEIGRSMRMIMISEQTWNKVWKEIGFVDRIFWEINISIIGRHSKRMFCRNERNMSDLIRSRNNIGKSKEAIGNSIQTIRQSVLGFSLLATEVEDSDLPASDKRYIRDFLGRYRQFGEAVGRQEIFCTTVPTKEDISANMALIALLPTSDPAFREFARRAKEEANIRDEHFEEDLSRTALAAAFNGINIDPLKVD
jgi:hypothetical protein